VSEAEARDEPVAEDERPWERPGAVRRDYLPHRGWILRSLGIAATGLGVLSLSLIVPGVFALILAFVVYDMARRDLADIQAGRMDPAGRLHAEDARFMALVTPVITLFGWAWWGTYAFLVNRGL
jgi:hypothetical protein